MLDCLSSYLAWLRQCIPSSIYSYTMYGIVHLVYLSSIVKQAMSINSIRTCSTVQYSTVLFKIAYHMHCTACVPDIYLAYVAAFHNADNRRDLPDSFRSCGDHEGF